MKRTAICLFVSVVIAGWGASASAQGAAAKDSKETKDSKDAKAGGADDDTSTGIEGLDSGTNPEGKTSPDAAAVKAAANLSWADIVVLPRKAFLKGMRFELAPYTGTSLNDIMIRHYVFGVDLNFFLTDVLWVGLQGNYYIKALTERESLVGLQFNRIPTLNRYLYGAALNFGYVPVYGKFALFNSSIVHWEVYVSAGIGVTRTEIIPRVPGDGVFSNNSLTPNVALGGRFFIFDWLTLNYAVRDYVIADKFEPLDRGRDGTPLGPNRNGGMGTWSTTTAQRYADSSLVNNIMFYVGAGIYFPTKFSYKLPR